MNKTFDVTFLGESYTFPYDMLSMKKEYDYLSDQKEACLSHFDFNFEEKNPMPQDVFYNGLKYYAEHYIQKLCDQGIYDKDVEKYIYDNEGYRQYLEMNSDAKQTINFIHKEANDMLNDVEEAEKKLAADQVTGSGVTVYSSSFATLFANAVAESVVVNSQNKKAIEQYNSRMYNAREKTSNMVNRMTNNYYNETYHPGLQAAIFAAISNMLKKYWADLSEHGLFDLDVIKYFDIDRSNALVKNLRMIADKKSVLLQAFEAYPFNENIYIEAARLGLLNKADIKTANILRIENNIVICLSPCPKCGFQYILKTTQECPKCGTKVNEYLISQLQSQKDKEIEENNNQRTQVKEEKISKYEVEQKEQEQERLDQIPATKKELDTQCRIDYSYNEVQKVILILLGGSCVISLVLAALNYVKKTKFSGYQTLLLIAIVIFAIISICLFLNKWQYVDQQYENVIKKNPEGYKRAKLKEMQEIEIKKIQEEVNAEYDQKAKEIIQKYQEKIDEISNS